MNGMLKPVQKFVIWAITDNQINMSLLNNNKNKDKKKGKQQQGNKSSFMSPKAGGSNTKGAARNTRFTGGAQRGS
jgi:hemolysin-activating ACP:hemolysin acyltransferase